MRPGKAINLTLTLDRDWSVAIKVFNNTKSGNIETRTAFDYTGYEAKMQVRSKPNHPDVLLELSTTDYSITLSGGLFTILVPRATINASSLQGDKAYVFDTVITDSDGSYDHIYGTIDVIENVTDVD